MPKKIKKFKFETTFAAEDLKVYSPSSEDKYLAKASLDSLKPLLDNSINLEENYDLLGVTFNAFVANRGNKNGQIISTDVALNCVENFKFKAMNLEHKRENVVGAITSYGFSEFGTNKILSRDDVKSMTTPFNVVLSGFVWKVVNESFAEKLEDASDPSSLFYMSIATSWEMGFGEYNIVKGSKNFNECSIISEEDEIKKLKPRLKQYGGDGLDEDGSPLFLNLIGEVLPLGIGFTQRPAAEVKGVKVANSPDETSECEEEVGASDKKSIKNSSQNIIPTVTPIVYIPRDSTYIPKDLPEKLAASFEDKETKKTNIKNNNTMIIKSFSEINDDVLKQLAASDVTDLFQSEMKKANDQFVTEKGDIEAKLREAADANAKIQASLDELKSAKEQLEKDLGELRQAEANRVASETFQSRMSTLDNDYELTDEDRQVIGEQIKSLDQDNFDKWFASFKIIASAKSKEAIEAAKMKIVECKTCGGEIENGKSCAKCDDKSKVKASEQVSASETEAQKQEEAQKALEEVKSEEVSLPNGGGAAEVKNRWANAFNKNTIKVS